MKDYLFVYGTLRKNYNLRLKNRVKNDLEYVGKAKIGASLYDLGRYPGAVKDKEGHEIIGDVFLLSDPDRVFKILDEYEGYQEDETEDSEFIRKRNRVKLNSGKNVNAWVYWYNLNPGNKVKIKHKDYLNYLKIKSIG
jgi:gamma-glutamylcyclotransferase (GGCT)/AIG2-like uncharacterized protein YtfP